MVAARARQGKAIPATSSTKMAAENGAAFLYADLGITPETRDDHAAYIASWRKFPKDDEQANFTAASHAQNASASGRRSRRSSKNLATPLQAILKELGKDVQIRFS